MKLTLVLSLLLSASAAQAFDCAKARATPPRGNTWKECKYSERKGSDIKEFLLDNEGNFFAYYADINQKCQLTSGVKDFKASLHPTDVAIAYYVNKANDLYLVGGIRSGKNCPSAKTGFLANDVTDWQVISDINTTIVNIALQKNGVFYAYSDKYKVYTDVNVKDVSVNQCYKSGKNFSSIALFTLDTWGNVTKVKGDSGRYTKDAVDNNNGHGWKSIKEFKTKIGVCK